MRHAPKLNLLLRAEVLMAVVVICRALCLLLDIYFLLRRRSLRPWIWRQYLTPDYRASHPRWQHSSQIGLVTFTVDQIQGLTFILRFSSTFWWGNTNIYLVFCLLMRTVTIIHQYLVLRMWADGKNSLEISISIICGDFVRVELCKKGQNTTVNSNRTWKFVAEFL